MRVCVSTVHEVCLLEPGKPTFSKAIPPSLYLFLSSISLFFTLFGIHFYVTCAFRTVFFFFFIAEGELV